jgi:DNA-binding CsgD family transcriptional regulator
VPSWARANSLRGRQRECEALERCIEGARDGHGNALVMRGEPGVGKSALLDYLVEQSAGCRVERLAGVESEMELPFAGLNQLCAPLLGDLKKLPEPQRDALATALGLSSGPPPSQFLVGLAVLTLLAEVGEEQPLVCAVDDAHWLDQVSAASLLFAARRLVAEHVTLVFAVRDPSEHLDLTGMSELAVGPLSDSESRALLNSVIPGPIDEQVRERIVAETRGNPLALIELPWSLAPAELAGGFAELRATPLASVLEQRFLQRIEALPGDTRQLLLISAVEPTGDVALLWRAAELLGIAVAAAGPAEGAGLLELDTHVRFRHPVVRSAVALAATPEERRTVHRALADATDSELDPDRRAWHRARGTAGLDESVAAELERGAARARSRGGLAAAAAFLTSAVTLTPDASRRAERALTAARTKRDAGALEEALDLLHVVEAGPPDALRTAEIEHLRGQIAVDQRGGGNAARLLLHAAQLLEPLDADLARAAHLESLGAAIWANGLEGENPLLEAAEAAADASADPTPSRPADLLLEAFTVRVMAGHGVAVTEMVRALDAVRRVEVEAEDVGRWLWMVGNRGAGQLALELWDFESWEDLARRQTRIARERGALVQLQFGLNFLASVRLVAGDLTEAEELIDEDRSIAQATNNPPIAYCGMLLAALAGSESDAAELIDATAREASARGQGRVVGFADYASALLYNGLGRYDAARDAAWRAFRRDLLGLGTLVAPELVEAASRTGDADAGTVALTWLSERAAAVPTDWALGIEARSRALLDTSENAEASYHESIERLGTTRLRLDLARSQLLYGEWLRRAGRRVDARKQLRAAHELLLDMRADAFADRARRELLATGETVRKRTVDTRLDLTPQEAQIARLAAGGETNPEIGSQLFISARTVEWHLRKVFTKLGISSRKELRSALVTV